MYSEKHKGWPGSRTVGSKGLFKGVRWSPQNHWQEGVRLSLQPETSGLFSTKSEHSLVHWEVGRGVLSISALCPRAREQSPPCLAGLG